MYTEYEKLGKEGKWGLPKAVDKCPTQLARNSWPPSALTPIRSFGNYENFECKAGRKCKRLAQMLGTSLTLTSAQLSVCICEEARRKRTAS